MRSGLSLLKQKRTDPEKLMIIIKPGRKSNMYALVKVLDEMTINAVKRYAMVDPEPVETILTGAK